MEKIIKDGKTYEVEEVNFAGAIVNVNGTSITDYENLEYITGKFKSIGSGDKPVVAKVYYQEVIDKYVIVLDQCGNTAALEPAIENGKLKSLWMRPIEMTLPAVFTTKKPNFNNKPSKDQQQ